MDAESVEKKKRYPRAPWLLAAGALLLLAGAAFFRVLPLAAVINRAERLLPSSCAPGSVATSPPGSAARLIPSQGDWSAPQVVLEPGAEGEWDHLLWGAISPAAVLVKEGTTFLYYIGADGTRSTDEDARHRALGVATSTDGIHFTKYAGNPILTHLPHNNEEEGIFSAAATLDAAGNVLLTYGAMDAGNAASERVDGDARVAFSPDGLHFTDVGDVLLHADSTVWGYGDELFPVGAFHDGERWNLYYIAKGHAAYWDLGIASGATAGSLPDSAGVLTQGSDIIGGGNAVWLNDHELALFLVRDFERNCIEARLTTVAAPGILSDALVTWDFGSQWRNAALRYDRQSGAWFLYQLNLDDGNIHVRTVSGE